jgi:hypothetical protein
METTQTTQASVAALTKSYMLISSKHINLNELNAFESVALAVTLMLTITAGTALSYLMVV